MSPARPAPSTPPDDNEEVPSSRSGFRLKHSVKLPHPSNSGTSEYSGFYSSSGTPTSMIPPPPTPRPEMVPPTTTPVRDQLSQLVESRGNQPGFFEHIKEQARIIEGQIQDRVEKNPALEFHRDQLEQEYPDDPQKVLDELDRIALRSSNPNIDLVDWGDEITAQRVLHIKSKEAAEEIKRQASQKIVHKTSEGRDNPTVLPPAFRGKKK